jgi:transcriptional activator SPT8
MSTSYRQPTPAVATRPSQDSSVSTKKSQTTSSDTTTLETDTKDSQYSAMAIDSQTQDSNLQPMVIESDVRSDTSFDPLFDDIPEETPQPQFTIPTESKLAMPGGAQPQTQLPQPRPSTNFIPPPKNAPPLLDFDSYSTYSPELLLTASIDGQVILWDRRVQTSGTGVGRLWMSEKTPPWCLSVQSLLVFRLYIKVLIHCMCIFSRLAGQQMELRYMRVVGMVRLTFGMHDF